MSTTILLQIIIGAICTGALYGLVSSAFSFQFGSLNIINFAFGSFTMVGMYLVFIFVAELGMNLYLFALLLVIVYFLFGFIMRAAFLRSSDHHVQIIVTLGIALILENIVLYIWGAMPRTVDKGIPATWKVPMGDGGMLIINQVSVYTLIVAALVLIGFAIFLKKTWLGITIRAVVGQREVSYLMGINSEKIVNIGFGISFIMTAISSLMLALQFTIEPMSGHFYQLIGFLVCLIAGMGNLKGGFIAGIIVGLVSSLVNVFAAQWHDPIIFILFVIILIWFPHGVFTSKKNISRAV